MPKTVPIPDYDYTIPPEKQTGVQKSEAATVSNTGSAAQEDIEAIIAPKPVILSASQAENICQGYLSDLKRAGQYYEDNPTARASLFDTVREFTAQETQVGNPDQFHNFAATLGGDGFDGLACDILDCGLSLYPMNATLLSDYLLYGIDCGRMENCKKYFTILESIERSEWTWRCFAFSISYVNRLRDSYATTAEERNYYKKKVTELAHSYKKYLPYEEGGYRESALLLSKKPEAMLKILNEALSNELLGACPTCALEKARILFKQKKYKDAVVAIDRSLEDFYNQSQVKIELNYLYFLRGLCNCAILLQIIRINDPINDALVLDIYADFNKALRIPDEKIKQKIKIRTQDLVEDTKVQVPDDMERLLDLIEI